MTLLLYQQSLLKTHILLSKISFWSISVQRKSMGCMWPWALWVILRNKTTQFFFSFPDWDSLNNGLGHTLVHMHLHDFNIMKILMQTPTSTCMQIAFSSFSWYLILVIKHWIYTQSLTYCCLWLNIDDPIVVLGLGLYV